MRLMFHARRGIEDLGSQYNTFSSSPGDINVTLRR